MAEYPLTVLFTWNPSGPPFTSLKEATNAIKLWSASYPSKWEVITTVKTCNATPAITPGKGSADKRKGKEQKSSIVFLEYGDSNGVCVIHSKDSSQYSTDDVLIADENIENLLTPYGGLTHRSTRKIQGFRYHLNDYVVCIGLVDSGPLLGHLVLELTYLGREFRAEPEEMFSQLCALANSFIPSGDRNPNLQFRSFFRPFTDPAEFSLSNRALLWIESLQLLQS